MAEPRAQNLDPLADTHRGPAADTGPCPGYAAWDNTAGSPDEAQAAAWEVREWGSASSRSWRTSVAKRWGRVIGSKELESWWSEPIDEGRSGGWELVR